MRRSTRKTFLTLGDKIKVISLHDQGVSVKRIASEFDIGRTQVHTLLKNEANIRASWEQGTSSQRKVLRTRLGCFDDVNSAVYEWFLAARRNHEPVTGVVLQTKAMEIARSLKHSDFRASNGWLYKFQQRHNIGSRLLGNNHLEGRWSYFLISILCF